MEELEWGKSYIDDYYQERELIVLTGYTKMPDEKKVDTIKLWRKQGHYTHARRLADRMLQFNKRWIIDEYPEWFI